MTKAKGNIWKGIIMLVLGTVFMLPVFLIVMNSFKTGKEILTNFVSFPTSLYLDNFVQAMKICIFFSEFGSFNGSYGIYIFDCQLSGSVWNFSPERKIIIRLLYLFYFRSGHSVSCGYDCHYDYGEDSTFK